MEKGKRLNQMAMGLRARKGGPGILVVVGIVALVFGVAYAKESYTDDFNSTYGTTGGYDYQPILGSCLTCHPSGTTQKNTYANDWKRAGHSFSAVEALDSDGDGYSNLDEIVAGTFPGDPASRPSPVPAPNQPSVANAGANQTVDEGQVVTLNGSNSSDPDDGIVSYAWVQLSGPAVVLSNASGAAPTFTAPDVGMSGVSLTFQLTVTDAGGLSDTATCVVNVSPATVGNLPPMADAGGNQSVAEGDTVVLNGTASSDPDDGIASYLWTQTGGPAVTLSNPTAAQPTFAAPAVGPEGATLTFKLTVKDRGGLQATDSCQVLVTNRVAQPVPDVKINGQDGPLVLSPSDPLSLSVSLDPGEQAGREADWWLGAYVPGFGWFSMVIPEGWKAGIYPCVQIPLFKLLPVELFTVQLPEGDYFFFMALDDNADGVPDATWLDYVAVSVRR